MAAPARVLVVDDSPTIRRVVSAILERHGYAAVRWDAEMLRLFGVLGAKMGDGPAAERERRLRDAIAVAMEEYD